MNGNLFSAQGIETLQAFSISIGIGLLMGLERERLHDSPAGLRTFALIALFGSVCGMLAQHPGSRPSASSSSAPS